MKRRFLRLVRSIPVLGPAAERTLGKIAGLRFDGSTSYWDDRYRRGGTSGEGSSGRLAAFKAEVINGFIEREGVSTVIEFGCGDGRQLALLRCPSYIGLDVSPRAISLCRERFQADPSKSFHLYSPAGFADKSRAFSADLGLSLDVIYHLVEDEIFERYMSDLFGASGRHVLIYSSNDDRIADIGPHVRHREFSRWIARNCADWTLTSRIPNPFPYDEAAPKEGTSFADFYIYQRTPRAPAGQ